MGEGIEGLGDGKGKVGIREEERMLAWKDACELLVRLET